MYGTKVRINSINLSVHHAIPLKKDYGLRLENANLITLCGIHHEMAERGEISLNAILDIIKQQENMPPGQSAMEK